EEYFSYCTASPVLGSLNSGMQLYRIKKEKPKVFRKIKYALHLPQYLSFLISGKVYTDITSLGCHTNLWDFNKNAYHTWVEREGMLDTFAPIVPSDTVVPATFPGESYGVGTGLHDSSAALIPYLVSFSKPFILISTGTWCITFNPFNKSPLTKEELKADCLCYMQYQGSPVKASRLFAGYEHEKEIKRIADFFNQSTAKYRSLSFDTSFFNQVNDAEQTVSFSERELTSFSSDVEA